MTNPTPQFFQEVRKIDLDVAIYMRNYGIDDGEHLDPEEVEELLHSFWNDNSAILISKFEAHLLGLDEEIKELNPIDGKWKHESDSSEYKNGYRRAIRDVQSLLPLKK